MIPWDEKHNSDCATSECWVSTNMRQACKLSTLTHPCLTCTNVDAHDGFVHAVVVNHSAPVYTWLYCYYYCVTMYVCVRQVFLYTQLYVRSIKIFFFSKKKARKCLWKCCIPFSYMLWIHCYKRMYNLWRLFLKPAYDECMSIVHLQLSKKYEFMHELKYIEAAAVFAELSTIVLELRIK